MSEERTLGQAVVTDPGEGRASGYVLVAASPSVSASERAWLQADPQVSDWLHLQEKPGTFYSFCLAPEGRYAFTKRFAHGQRRGTFNRLVAHTLLVPRAVLDDLVFDPWLLVKGCHFRAHGAVGEPQRYSKISQEAAAVGLDTVEDLTCRPPAEPEGRHFATLHQWRETLLGQWGEALLEEYLHTAYAAFEAGTGLILPQERDWMVFLLFAWSALPWSDRERYPWTTHFAPGGGAKFHLANSPDPHQARREQRHPEAWQLIDDEELPGGGCAPALARAVASGHPALKDLAVLLRREDQDAEMPRVWLGGGLLSLLEEAREPIPERAESLAAVEDFLDRRGFDNPSRPVPKAQRAPLLALLARLVQQRVGQGEEPGSALATVRELLERRGLEEIHTFETACALLSRSPALESPSQAAAVALYLHGQGDYDREELESFLPAILKAARHSLAGGGGQDSASQSLEMLALLELTVALCRADSPALDEPFSLLLATDEQAQITIRRVQERPDSKVYLALLEAATRVAEGQRGKALSGQISAELAVRLLADRPEAKTEFRNEGVVATLTALRARPDAIVWALSRWPSEIYPHILERLSDWATTDRVALGKVTELLASSMHEENGREWARSLLKVCGMARTLVQASAPAQVWLPFALAEAEVLEHGEDEVARRSFEEFLRQRRKSKPRHVYTAKRLIHWLQRAPPAHGPLRELATLLVMDLAASHQSLVPALARLNQLPGNDFLAWGPTVHKLAKALADGSHGEEASIVVRNYWVGLGTGIDWQRLPKEIEVMLHQLNSLDRQHLVDHLGPRLTKRGGSDAARLPGRVVDLLLGTQRIEKQLEPMRKPRSSRREPGHVQALDQLGARLLAGSLKRDEYKHEAAKALPDKPQARSRALIQCLLSPTVAPSSKRFAEEDLCESMLQEAAVDTAWAPGPVESIAERGRLFLLVARLHGSNWEKDPERARTFLQQAVKLERFDAVGAFLRGARRAKNSALAYRTLVKKSDRGTQKLLREATQHPAHWWDLQPFVTRGPKSRVVRQLLVRAQSRKSAELQKNQGEV